MLIYHLTAGSDGSLPAMLTLTQNSADAPEPPQTRNVAVAAADGTVRITGLATDRRHDFYISTATATGVASASVRVDLPPAV